MNHHTPGPWKISGQLITGAPEPFPNPKADPMGKTVASIAWDYDGDRGATEYRIQWSGEGKSNARLIAAAPDLLAACIEVQEMLAISDKGMESKTYRMVSAAIAKATGGDA